MLYFTSRNQKNETKKPLLLIILRIDFNKDQYNDRNGWIKYNGLWLFTVIQIDTNHNEQTLNYEYYLNNYNMEQIVHSQECLTLNCARNLFHQYLTYQLYQNHTKMVFSQNTKFDQLNTNHNIRNNNNNNNTNNNHKYSDVFELL